MSAYWIQVSDRRDHHAIIETKEDFDAWIDLCEVPFTVSLMLGNDLVDDTETYAVDLDELIEDVTQMGPMGNYGRESLQDTYTKGDCDVFAVALQKLIGGDLYAVWDNYDDKGRRARTPWLVHAGVYEGDDVIDITGRTEQASWVQTWWENGGVYDGDHGEVTARRLRAMQKTKHTPKELARATQVAWLIAALTSTLSDQQMDQYRAIRAETLRMAA